MRIEMGWGNNRQVFNMDSKKKFTNIAGTKAVSAIGLNLSISGKDKAAGGAAQKNDGYKSQLDSMREQFEAQRKGAAIKAIESKLMAGKTMTAEELEYLREHAPDLYEKAMKVAREREAYKKELEAARSKEEVRKIQERHVQQFANELKTIPKSDIGAMKFLMMRMNGILDEHRIFTESDEYKRLPEKSDEPDKSEDKDETPEEDNAQDVRYEDNEDTDDPVQYLNDMFGESSVSVPEETGKTGESVAQTDTDIDLPGSSGSGEAETPKVSVSANIPSNSNVGTTTDIKA